MNNDEIKEVIKKKYTGIALKQIVEGDTCCSGCSVEGTYTTFSESYSNLPGYTPAADLKLGCGMPTEAARIRKGDIVLDLGSGAGNDVFVARSLVGEEGKVIGLDMTEAMVEKARANAKALGYSNVEFHLGEIESMPLPDLTADVVISNCVLNLVPDKKRAFKEIRRVLKTGGHFTVSDIVLNGIIPQELKSAAEMYAGCVSGAIQKKEYLKIISAAGFQNIEVVTEKPQPLPDEILLQYLTPDKVKDMKTRPPLLLSITVYAEKANQNDTLIATE